MTQDDVELEKLAWRVFTESLDYLEIPDYVTVNKKDDGTFSCMIMLSYKVIGSTYIHFNPSTEIVKGYLVMSKGENEMPEKLGRSLDYGIARVYAYSFLKNFFAEIEETISNLTEIPLLMPQMLISNLTNSENEKKKDRLEYSKKSLESILESRKQRVKERINAEIQYALEPKQAVTHLIAVFYKDLLVKWEKAKDFYKRNKDFDNWEKMISISITDLPPDLIARLSDADTYVAMPSSIALEHTARICGIKPNSLGLRALQKHLQQSREWIEKNGDEKVAEEMEIYRRRVINEIAIAFQLGNELGKPEFPFDKYSLMHKLIVEEMGETIKNTVAIKNSESEQKNDEQEGNDVVH